MLVTTKAIVINSLKFSEADLVVKCFTYSHGLKTYLLRSVLKSKRGKLKASMFQPLTQLEIVASHKNQGTLESIKEAKVINTYQTFHTNIYKSSMIIFLSEMLKNAVQEEEKNVDLYDFLEQQFNWLDNHDTISNFHLFFLLHLTRYLGFFPEAPKQEFTYFNMLDGTFQNIETNSYCISDKNMEILVALLGIKFVDQSSVKLNQTKRSDFLNMLLLYYDLHLQNFKKPKSLGVLTEIFN